MNFQTFTVYPSSAEKCQRLTPKQILSPTPIRSKRINLTVRVMWHDSPSVTLVSDDKTTAAMETNSTSLLSLFRQELPRGHILQCTGSLHTRHFQGTIPRCGKRVSSITFSITAPQRFCLWRQKLNHVYARDEYNLSKDIRNTTAEGVYEAHWRLT